MRIKRWILAGLLGALALVFLFGVTLYPYPAKTPSGNSLEPPGQHLLGTDDLGMDIFAQISAGFFSSMLVGLGAAAITFAVGGVLGVAAGYIGGKADALISFLINVMLSIPQLPVMIVLGAFFGQSLTNVIVVISAFSWAGIAKVMRDRTLSVRERDYIRLAKSYGGKSAYIIKTHMLGELLPLLTVQSLGVIGKAIVQESSLAFLGLSDPLAKSWGMMISKAMSFSGIYFTNYWTWWLLPPVMALVATILLLRLMNKQLEKVLTGNG